MSLSLGARFVNASSNALRKIGGSLDNLGAKLEVAKYTERLVPSTRFVAVDGVAPTVSKQAAFIAPSANVIGNVNVGNQSSIWYGATVRGDVNTVTIGNNTNVGDRAVVHVAKIQGDLPTVIGNDVTIEAGAVIHACVIEDKSIIGSNAQVLDGAVVASNCIVGPGSVISPGTKLESGYYYSGIPATKTRALTKDEIASITSSAKDTAELALEHAWECSKDYKQIIDDEENHQDAFERDDEIYSKDAGVDADVLDQGAPGMIFDTTLSRPDRINELHGK